MRIDRERLFNDWRALSQQVNDIASIVQNPLCYVTLDDIRHYNDTYVTIEEKLQRLHRQMRELLNGLN